MDSSGVFTSGLGCVAAICLFDLRQYHLFFVQYNIYEPIPKELLRAVKIFVN